MYRTSSVGSVVASGALAVALLCPAAVHAQLDRTAVSSAGDDGNSCAPASPCRTFARAMSQTNANGEILVLNSAGYGPFTIDRSVTVQAAPGVYAGVAAPSGNGITLGMPGGSGKAVIRGLTLQGLGTGSRGIYGFATIVHVENCIIDGFNEGIVTGSYTLTVSDTEVRNNVARGIVVANAGTRAVLERVRLKNNGDLGLGVQDSGKATIRNSVVVGNQEGIAGGFSAVVNVESTLVTRGVTGVYSDSSAVVRVSDSFVTDNSSAGLRNDHGTMESWQNNKVRGNFVDFGSGSGGVLTNLVQQ